MKFQKLKSGKINVRKIKVSYLIQRLCPENLKISRPETMFQEIWKYPVQRLCPEKSEGERISGPQAIYMDTSIYIMLKGREYPAPKPFIWIPLYTFMLYTKISRPETMSEFRVGDYVSDFLYKIIYKKYFLCDWLTEWQSDWRTKPFQRGTPYLKNGWHYERGEKITEIIPHIHIFCIEEGTALVYIIGSILRN